MPRPASQAVQVLQALQQTFKPLVAKRIKDDIQIQTNLNISNSRHTFIFELGQILLNPGERKPEEYESFLGNLDRLLRMLKA